MVKFKEYKYKYRLGDIPGDQCIDWWGPKDWADWREHVTELKANGDYGKEEEVTIVLACHPKWDTPKIPKPELESYRMEFIDFSNETK